LCSLAVRSVCAMFAPIAPCDSAWMLSRALSKHRIASSSHSPPTPIWAPRVGCRLPFTDYRFQGW
jgi:hypothetical protein